VKLLLKKMLNDNKGLTLVELIIGVMIFAVITTSAMSIFMPMMRTMMRANEISEYNTLFDNIATLIINDLSSSTGEAVIQRLAAPGQPLEQLRIHIEFPGAVIYEYDANGILLRNGNPLLPERFFGWTTVTIECENIFEDDDDIDDVVYNLTITLSDSLGNAGLFRTFVVRPLVLNQFN